MNFDDIICFYSWVRFLVENSTVSCVITFPSCSRNEIETHKSFNQYSIALLIAPATLAGGATGTALNICL